MRTALVAALATLATAVALLVGRDAVTLLTADEIEVVRGQLWRVVTGPLVHATWGHLLRDLALLVGVGLAYEQPLSRFWSLLLAAGLIVPTLVVLATPSVSTYYGLSGLSHTVLAAAIAYECRTQRGRARLLAVIVGVGLLLKVVADVITGGMFAVSLAPGVAPAPLAHLAGALAGAAIAMLAPWKSRRTAPSSAAIAAIATYLPGTPRRE